MRKSGQTRDGQPAWSGTTKGEARRAQILDAATECFRREGFHGSSMARIAATAGMSTGHVFHYFKRKEDIVGAIVARERTVMEGFAERLRAAGNQADMLDLIHAGVIDVLTRQAGGSSPALTMEILAEAARNPEIGEMLRSYDEQARQVMGGTLEDAAPGGATRRELLAALVEGLSIRKLRNPGLPDTLDSDVLRQVLASIISG